MGDGRALPDRLRARHGHGESARLHGVRTAVGRASSRRPPARTSRCASAASPMASGEVVIVEESVGPAAQPRFCRRPDRKCCDRRFSWRRRRSPAWPGPDLVPPVWRTLAGLVIVLALVAGLAWLMRRGLLGRRANPGAWRRVGARAWRTPVARGRHRGRPAPAARAGAQQRHARHRAAAAALVRAGGHRGDSDSRSAHDVAPPDACRLAPRVPARLGVGGRPGRRRGRASVARAASVVSQPASAAPQNLAIQINGLGSISAPLQIVVLMTLLTFVPAALVMMTSFTRIAIVFHFLRQAIGTQDMPSNQMLIGLTLFLTVFIMAPTATRINEAAHPAGDGRADRRRHGDRRAARRRSASSCSSRRAKRIWRSSSSSRACRARRRRPDLPDARRHPGLRDLRAEDRVPDGLLSVRPVPARRPGRVDDARCRWACCSCRR